jgi:hypothetical protein
MIACAELTSEHRVAIVNAARPNRLNHERSLGRHQNREPKVSTVIENNESEVAPRNPFTKPIAALEREIAGVEWQFPYIAQLVQLGVILFVTVVCVVLYCTIGVITEVCDSIQALIKDAQRQMHKASLMEKSAYGITIGIYSLIYVPAFLVLLPFLLVGWLWTRLGSLFTLIFFLVVAAVVVILLREHVAVWLHAVQRGLPGLHR